MAFLLDNPGKCKSKGKPSSLGLLLFFVGPSLDAVPESKKLLVLLTTIDWNGWERAYLLSPPNPAVIPVPQGPPWSSDRWKSGPADALAACGSRAAQLVSPLHLHSTVLSSTQRPHCGCPRNRTPRSERSK